MPSLKEVRNRISSTIGTQQITSAMKMVSASKLRRAQDAIIAMRPFSEKLDEILENLLDSGVSSVGDFGKPRPVGKVTLIVLTSNRGLCGGFNSSVIKSAVQILNTRYSEQAKKGNVKLICIGKKGADFFRKSNAKDLSAHNHLWDKLTYAGAAEIMEGVIKDYAAGETDKVEIIYNQFKNAATQILSTEQILPFENAPAKNEAKQGKAKASAAPGPSSKSDYIFEPGKEDIIREIIPYSLKVRLFRSLLDSFAAEHGARMTAMHKATDNAQELLRNLRLTYNKARQAAITKEILEIVGGAEAIKN